MDLESFGGFDTGDQMDEKSFEKFKEKFKAAQAQIAAIKKEESKRKKKEDELLKILLKFVKTSHKQNLVLLISRALEQNLPANFILAVVVLSNEEIQEETGDFLLLKEASKAYEEREYLNGGEEGSTEAKEKSLIFFGKDESLPLKIRIQLDAWLKGLLYQAEETPEKMLRTSYDIEIIKDDLNEKIEEKKTIKIILTQIIAFILRDFLEQNGIEEDYEKLKDFAYFVIKGILEKTEENYTSRRLLET